MIRQINRNFNVYDATKQGYKAELPELDFTKVQAREQARVNAEIARKQDLAKLQDTGLYNIFDSDVRRDVEALTKDVAEGRLDPKSQEYYNRYTSIGGKTKRYKTVSDQINNVYESYLKDPSKFVWNDADGNVYTGQEGMNMWRESLNQSSPEGMSFEEISTMAIEPARNLDSRIDLDTTKTQAYGKNLFENFAKNNDLQYSEMAGGEIVLLTQDKELPKGYREELKANLITAFAKPISQNYGIMKAQNSLPTYPAGHKNEGQPMTPEDYAKDFADKQIPNIVSTSEFRNKKGRAELANLNARTAKLNKENQVGTPNTTYGLKVSDSTLTEEKIAGMPFAIAFKGKVGEETEYNKQTLPTPVKTVIDGSNVQISGALYNPKKGKFFVYGAKPSEGTNSVTTSVKIPLLDENGDPATDAAGKPLFTTEKEVDYEKTKTEPFMTEVNKNDYISFLMGGKYDKETATKIANDIEAKQQEEAQQQGGEKAKNDSELSASEWNSKWQSLKSGESMVGLDGKTYTKK